MSDFFSKTEKESLCQKNEETVRAESCVAEKVGGQDGKYMFRYIDCAGQRQTVYSWKLVSTDKLREGQRESQALRDIEKSILKDLDDKIKTNDAEHTTVNDLFEQFMDIRKDLRESSRCCYNGIYRKHIKPVLGDRPIGQVKPTHRDPETVPDDGVCGWGKPYYCIESSFHHLSVV